MPRTLIAVNTIWALEMFHIKNCVHQTIGTLQMSLPINCFAFPDGRILMSGETDQLTFVS